MYIVSSFSIFGPLQGYGNGASTVIVIQAAACLFVQKQIFLAGEIDAVGFCGLQLHFYLCFFN